MWNLYLITNGEYTYVGITNDLKKRIRQHNGEIKGGAKYTKDRGTGWKYALIVSGLTKSSAYSFEYKVKHPFKDMKKDIVELCRFMKIVIGKERM